MKRSTRRALVHPSLFILALFTILYLGRPSESDKNFRWTSIRYQTTASDIPEARGTCPGLKGSTKPALVVARIVSEDKSWQSDLEEKYHLCIYTADAPVDLASGSLQVPANRGHEAMAYLTFLIDNYDVIPDQGVVFVHGSRFAWHNDHPLYDNKVLLQDLNISAALAFQGYHNLRCDWSAGTCPPSEKPQGSWETASRMILEVNNRRVISDATLPSALASLFSMKRDDTAALLGRRDAVRSQCCAQFVVSQKNIYQHKKDEYVALRQWLLDGSLQDMAAVNQQQPIQDLRAAPADDYVAGRVLSYLWHILFLPSNDQGVNLKQLNAMACPAAGECYCRLYGRCNLGKCSKGQCPGQYILPQGYTLPSDWAALHS